MKRAEVAQYWEANAETWTQHARAGYDIYRDGLNTPAFLDMLPPIRGLSGLDVGCGEGSNTREFVRLGATVHAIDVGPTFIRYARDAERAEPLGIAYLVADATNLPFASGSFDIATAIMSLMDMADHGAALREAARVLRPGGFLQFSILHPCFVPPHRRVLREANGTTRAIEVGGRIGGHAGRANFSAYPGAQACRSAEEARFLQAVLPARGNFKGISSGFPVAGGPFGALEVSDAPLLDRSWHNCPRALQHATILVPRTSDVPAMGDDFGELVLDGIVFFQQRMDRWQGG